MNYDYPILHKVIDHYKNKIGIEKQAGALHAAQDIALDFLDGRMENDRIWDEAWSRASKTEDKKVRNQILSKAADDASAMWRSRQLRQEALYRALFDSIDVSDPFYFDFSYRELQANYSPAVGFVQRRGARRFNPEVGYTFRFRDHPWLRWMQHELDWDWYADDVDNDLITQTYQIKPLTIGFSDGSEFAYEVHPTYERLERDFEIRDYRVAVIPEGQATRSP